MRRLILPLCILAATGMILSIVGLVRTMQRMSSGSRLEVVQPDPASIGRAVPEFTLTDQDGKPQTQAIFDGQVTVLDFFFTHCPFICPMMTLAMQDLARDLAGTSVRFVSISVDPDHDTPARLREYATEKEIDLARWSFLTGDADTIRHIARDSLGFAVGPDDDPGKTITLPGGASMPNIIHPSKLILVGPDRKVLGFFESSSLEETQRLLLRARAAAKSRPR